MKAANPMRLGLMVYGPMNQLSGGYLYDRQLRNAWLQAGHLVEIISLPPAGYIGSLLHNWNRHWHNQLLGLEIDCLIQDELCHPSCFRLNSLIRNRVDYPIISLVHHLRRSERHPAPQAWLYSMVESEYLETVDGFIFNSNPTRVSVEQVLNRPVLGLVAPPGRDHIAPGGRKSRSKSPELQILFVGNLIERKGLHWLLQALEGLVNEAWHLHVVGRSDLEQSYADDIQHLLAQQKWMKRATYHGPVQSGSLARHYRRADLLAVPSSHEGFGLVYLEAMGHRMPVLASASGGASDLVQSGRNGFLINPGDIDELRCRLYGYIHDRDLLARHAEAAWQRYQRQPLWADSAQKIVEFLRTMY